MLSFWHLTGGHLGHSLFLVPLLLREGTLILAQEAPPLFFWSSWPLGSHQGDGWIRETKSFVFFTNVLSCSYWLPPSNLSYYRPWGSLLPRLTWGLGPKLKLFKFSPDVRSRLGDKMHSQSQPPFCRIRVCLSVLPECPYHLALEDCLVFISFLCNLADFIIVYRIHHTSFTLSDTKVI